MDDKNCNNCLQIKALEQQLEQVWHAVKESKSDRKEIDTRLKDLEEYKVETKGKFERIFESLEDIGKNVEKIATSLEILRNKDGKVFESLKYEIVRYIVLAVLAFIVMKFK